MCSNLCAVQMCCRYNLNWADLKKKKSKKGVNDYYYLFQAQIQLISKI